jgi:hypothetical protein
VTRVYDMYEEVTSTPYDPLRSAGFHITSTHCADGACLTVWAR